MARALSFLYGTVSYVLFLGVFLYAIAFVGDFAVPKTIDSGAGGSFWPALLTNLGLLGLFALQHSGMARPGFKKWWTKLIPKPIERSTYVLLASVVLALLMLFWRPLPELVWSVEAAWAQSALWGVFALGWLLVLAATFMISHFHLFGLRQIHEHLRGEELSDLEFQVKGLYRMVRHPLNFGFLLAFWATPEMTVGHLLFSVATTGYIFVAMYLEERDLVAASASAIEPIEPPCRRFSLSQRRTLRSSARDGRRPARKNQGKDGAGGKEETPIGLNHVRMPPAAHGAPLACAARHWALAPRIQIDGAVSTHSTAPP